MSVSVSSPKTIQDLGTKISHLSVLGVEGGTALKIGLTAPVIGSLANEPLFHREYEFTYDMSIASNVSFYMGTTSYYTYSSASPAAHSLHVSFYGRISGPAHGVLVLTWKEDGVGVVESKVIDVPALDFLTLASSDHEVYISSTSFDVAATTNWAFGKFC